LLVRAPRKDDFDREERFFGMNPLDVLDDIFKFVEKYTLDAFDAMELSMASAPGFEGKQKQELLTQALDALMSRYFNALDESFDKFELFALKRIFRLPTDVPEEDMKRALTGEVERDELDRKLADLQQQAKEAAARVAQLKTDAANMDSELSVVDRELALAANPDLQRKDKLPFASAATYSAPQEGMKHVLRLCSEVSAEEARLREVVKRAGLHVSDTSASGLLATESETDLSVDSRFRADQQRLPLNTSALNEFGDDQFQFVFAQ